MYSPTLILHIAGGLVAIIAGFVSLFARKGSLLHRRSGVAFSIAMLVMAGFGGYVSIIKKESINILASILTFYLVLTAWMTVRRPDKRLRPLEIGLMVVALATGVGAWIAAPTAHKGYAPILIVFGSVFVLAGIGDIRAQIRGGIYGAQRLARHLWRMCFALFIAAGSFFLGTASDPVLHREGLRARLFTKAVRATHLPQVPVLLIFVLMFFWLWRVRSANAYKKIQQQTQ